jgi:hypothetical protein
MPQANVHNTGNIPVIPASPARTSLVVQNNSAVDVRLRVFGPVSATTPAQSGLLLRAGGGFLQLQGSDAQRAVYALSADGSAVVIDYDSDVTA